MGARSYQGTMCFRSSMLRLSRFKKVNHSKSLAFFFLRYWFLSVGRFFIRWQFFIFELQLALSILIHLGNAAVTPPSTFNIHPVVFAERFEAKKNAASAMSSG